MEAKEALNLCSPSLMLFPKFKPLISTTTLAATAAEVRPFQHLLPSIKAYCSSLSSPVDLPPIDALLSGVDYTYPAAFTRGFRAPDSIKPFLSEPHLFLAALRSVRRDPRLALRFFRWAESQLGFPCSEAAFCAILQILAEGGLMHAAYSVAQRVLHLRLHGIVDLLIDGHAGPEATVPLLDLLLWLYTKCSMVEHAVSTFHKMVAHGFLPDVKNCNRILRILRDTDQWTEEGKAEEALKILGEMEDRDAGCLPNDITYNVIINGLSKKGELDKAEKLLDKMRLGNLKEALCLFNHMRDAHIAPNIRTYNILIDGHCRLGALFGAQKLKEEMICLGFLPDVYTYTILVNGFCKMGDLAMAKEFFDEMLQKGVQPDCYAYTTIIVGELNLGDTSKAFQLREEMKAKGITPNAVTYNVLIDGLCKMGNRKDAYGLWQKMVHDGFHPNCVTYTCLINAHCKKGHLREAKNLFDYMLSNNLSPTVVTYTVLIHAHANRGNLEVAYGYFSKMLEENVLPNEITYNALINGLCRKQKVELAYELFHKMQGNGLSPNKYTYTLLINENCNLGNWKEALRLYAEMHEKGIIPDFCTQNVLFKGFGEDFKHHAVNFLETDVLCS
ncbi:hypothetical protein OPV22_017406 [Ensete ventricosum]|uniref:Pentacotripeptide-repeat region of PRORP domain-containing protein n=1 Tax=Ensete ventricosum TaxID=4639 RepID=A0AAV8QT50_ENSVE|nr:hypothetical protein OPV22_017406 [Ensete ventricosum]